VNPSTELILIRHGETLWNQQGRWQGHLDSELTATGLEQAEAVAGRLAGMALDGLYSSDLGRAYHTAERIASRAGLQAVAEPSLRERALGVFQGLTLAEIREGYAQEYEWFQARDPDRVIPGGESLNGRHRRVVKALQQIAGRHRGQRVAVVTHGGVLDSGFRHALGLSLIQRRRWVLYNGSLNTLLIQDGNWSVGTWGDVAHLSRTGTLDDY